MSVLRIFSTKKPVDIDRRFGNVRITSIKYSKPIENSDKWEHYTEISCWYDRDCENCPMGWEECGYEGECNDCGCLFDCNFRVPIWKCMLPKWIKNIIARHYKNKKVCPF